MGRAMKGLATGLVLAAISAGCQNKVYEQNKELVDENKALRDQNEALRRQQSPAQTPVQPATPPPAVAQTPPPAEPAPAPTSPPPAAENPKSVEQIGGLETTMTPRGNTVVHLPSDVFFDSGQATLKSSAKTSLDRVVAALRRRFSGRMIRVEGHTDSTPIRVSKWPSNQALSEARAKSVKDYLVAHGVAEGRISIRGYGDTRPRSGDLSKNRRVEIVVLTGE